MSKLLPGSIIPGTGGQAWVEWTMDDVDQSNRIKFIAEDVPSLRDNIRSTGQKNPVMKVNVNGLDQYITANVENDIPTFFYNAYKDTLDLYNATEEFKKYGSKNSPFIGFNGKPNWTYVPSAPTFGMDAEGRYLRYDDSYYTEKDGFKFILKDSDLVRQLYFDGYLNLNITVLDAAKIVLKDYTNRLINKLRRK